MNTQLKSLLKPEILNTVDGLELIARIIVEGFMSGSNHSQTIGIGQEFSQYRGYEPGDDLRLLDWKMYARSERYYVKLAEIETNITVKFVIDASNSMSYAEDGITKLQFAKILTAALAYLARKQSDTYGLYTINDKNIDVIRPRFEQQQFLRFLNALVKLKSEGSWHIGKNFESLLDHQGKEMILFVSDLYDDTEDILKFISNLKTSKNEVIVFHLLGGKEKDLSYDGSFTFEDLETNTRVKVDTLQQKTRYIHKLEAWLSSSRTYMLERQISYHLVSMNEPVGEVLRQFLLARKRLL